MKPARVCWRACSGAAAVAAGVGRRVQVCVVGAGPAGFYAAMHLTKKLPDVQVDIIEKLPVPFGLIRYGVAPDHPEVKNVINAFTKVARHPNVNFYGNITLGKDVTLSQLREHYNAVLLTYGAEEDKILGIENENVANVVPARRFVGWYNGLPEDKDLKVDLSGHTAAVLGQGNVAMDVARILLAPLDVLRKTDITTHALNALAESKIKNVYLIGRRGPLQAAFTIKELREQLKMPKCITIWKKEDFEGVEEAVSVIPRSRKRLTELMLKSMNDMRPDESTSEDTKVFRPVFLRSPIRFLCDNESNLKGVKLMCNKLIGDDIVNKSCMSTGITEVLDCNVAFRSIGYRSVKVDKDIPFDDKKGLVINNTGRAMLPNADGQGEEVIDWGLYIAGWLRTGPVGVILNTMSNAFQVAGVIIEDASKNSDKLKCYEPKGGFEEISKILKNKNVEVVDWAGWEKLDKFEVEEGKKLGKPREKVSDIRKMLEIALL